MKSILFLHSSSDLYGADRSLIRTINSVDKQLYNIIVCLPYDGPLAEYLQKQNIDVRIFELAVIRRKHFNVKGFFFLSFHFIKSIFILNQICRKGKVALIYSNTTAVLIGGIICWLRKVKHIWHVREIIKKPLVLRKLISFCLYHFSTRIVCVSQSTLDNLLIDQKNIINKSLVIYNGIELNRYQFGNRKKIRTELNIEDEKILVGMVGRVSHWKGQNLFLNIAKEVFHKNRSIKFIAIGSPFQGNEHLMDDFKNQVKLSKLDDNFIIVEFTPNVVDYLFAMDVFILPSILPDPFPTTVLEAMATKKAIIVNGHGGATEMIDDNKNGFIISPPNDLKLFVNRLETLISDTQKRNDFAKNAHEKVINNYTVDFYAENIKNLIIEVLG